MSVEAELKAVVREPDRVRSALGQRSSEDIDVYRDVYFDLPDHSFDAVGRELRVREIEGADGARRVLLTYKAPAVHESGSKPEFETSIGDRDTAHAILSALGYVELIAFEKHCRNYRFAVDDRDVQATLVTVPELDGSFLEVETIVSDGDVEAGLHVVRGVLVELGIDDADLTTEQYTTTVRERRQRA